MRKRRGRTAKILERVGHELKASPPRSVKRERLRKGPRAAEAMRRAILLSKARRAGADVPDAPRAKRRRGRTRGRT